jgi:PAS domain-containing protein
LFYAVARDVTFSKQAEAELRKSEATKRALLNAIPDMIFRCRADGTFVDFKPAKDFDNILPPKRVIGQKAQDILPAAFAEKIIVRQSTSDRHWRDSSRRISNAS